MIIHFGKNLGADCFHPLFKQGNQGNTPSMTGYWNANQLTQGRKDINLGNQGIGGFSPAWILWIVKQTSHSYACIVQIAFHIRKGYSMVGGHENY
ncbi:hypothetical protein SDC9_192652 [bioreactor metagenome]|uniref:Uncharacterized protein n=1 Tax=bioreactor metagenome TaxID=1076179 RepID=A0A645I1D2_9ZZZZ